MIPLASELRRALSLRCDPARLNRARDGNGAKTRDGTRAESIRDGTGWSSHRLRWRTTATRTLELNFNSNTERKLAMNKKILAILLAAMLVLTMAGSALAADMGASGTISTTDSSVTLKKAIEVTNYSDYGAYAPTITYTYTLSNGTAEGTVTGEVVDSTTDPKETMTVNYKAGLTSYLASSSNAVQTAVFTNTDTPETSGTTVSKDLTWTFDASKFPSAGVYRFVVAETSTSVAPANIGIERDTTYDTSKYLDVYVKNEDTGKAIYGYALVDDENSTVDSTKDKSQGWNAGTDLEKYKTYNLTITKKITGSGADMTAKFPFTVTLTGEMGYANITTAGSDGESVSSFATATGNTQSATVTGNLGDGKTIVIKGLPTTVSFSVAESNPTPDTYTISSVNVTGVTATGTTGTLAGNAADTSVLASTAIANTGTSAISVEVTNNLDLISPTGVVLRFAPYIIMAGIAVALLELASRRRKDAQDESDAI